MNWFEEILESGFGSSELDSLKAEEREKVPNLTAEIEQRKEELLAAGDTTFTDEDQLFYDEGASNLFFGNAGRDRDRILDAVARYQLQRAEKEKD
tara:strand:- start:4293 stop:4577 length:285 start_codon:yes stop_codon:yes gene_type:complete